MWHITWALSNLIVSFVSVQLPRKIDWQPLHTSFCTWSHHRCVKSLLGILPPHFKTTYLLLIIIFFPVLFTLSYKIRFKNKDKLCFSPSIAKMKQWTNLYFINLCFIIIMIANTAGGKRCWNRVSNRDRNPIRGLC